LLSRTFWYHVCTTKNNCFLGRGNLSPFQLYGFFLPLAANFLSVYAKNSYDRVIQLAFFLPF
jgi:hypothetical protein